MSKAIKIHGYEEFPSKSEAIRYLLDEGKLSTNEICNRLNCSHQHIYLARQSLKKTN